MEKKMYTNGKRFRTVCYLFILLLFLDFLYNEEQVDPTQYDVCGNPQ